MKMTSLFLVFSALILASESHGSQCLELFSDRNPVLLGEGQGGVVYRVYQPEIGFVARKMYFEKEEKENDRNALAVLRRLSLKTMRIVRWLREEELVVTMEYINGAPVSSSSAPPWAVKAYQDYALQMQHLFANRVDGVQKLDFYESKEDGLWRLSVRLRDKEGRVLRILLRPQNVLFLNRELVLVDPH